MLKWIDRSSALSRLIERVSTLLAKRRGLPVVIGVLLVIVSFVVQFINIYANTKPLEIIGVVALHVGILTALISLLLAEPLGK